ncbi:hypothetical protein IM697_04280 [Streptomyces ferrugineus]|uniref:Uncharacterized protein n=1 Tax=Streptomyces ferrugineus TaxID=1413221 RepID=A0A7M2SPK5_9ACTN|nr:hypothetical protein [Streptomyces ferrugineus]QOV37655.1 hypothetical protein IM697_04280 [Streptomyces ferrugineus]
MTELTWHKDAKPSTYYATHNGRRIATARKEGGAWIGTVVGLGFTFGGRRLMDVKELAQRHVERSYGTDGTWTILPARDLRPGMVLGCDTWRGEEREVVSVEVDADAQAVGVELSSESSRALGFNLDATYAMDAMVRVKAAPKLPEVEPVTEPTEGAMPVETQYVEPGDEVAVRGHGFLKVREIGSVRGRPGFLRMIFAEGVAMTRYFADEVRVKGESGPRAEWAESEVGQVIDLRPFTAVVDMIAGTGVLISPPASDDLSLSEGGASLHDALLADAFRRLSSRGVEPLEGKNGGPLLKGVTDDGRKVFGLYVSDCITTEPDFEEVAVSVEALRQAAGLAA